MFSRKKKSGNTKTKGVKKQRKSWHEAVALFAGFVLRQAPSMLHKMDGSTKK